MRWIVKAALTQLAVTGYRTKRVVKFVDTLLLTVGLNYARTRYGIPGFALVLGLLSSCPAQAATCSLTEGSIFPLSGTCAEVSAAVFPAVGSPAGGTPIPPRAFQFLSESNGDSQIS